jgi:hypothetical protein
LSSLSCDIRRRFERGCGKSTSMSLLSLDDLDAAVS